MRKLLTTAAILAATSSTAGGLSDPIIPPAVPEQYSPWAGAYVGLSYGRTAATTDIPDQYVYECAAGETEDIHNNHKCVIDSHAWENSPEVQALVHNDRPWGQYETQYRYNQPDYDGVWLGGADSFTYTTDQQIGQPEVSKPTTTTLIDTITELTNEASTAGVFAGYRWDLGVVLGVEASTDGTLSTAELSAGLPMGEFLFYGFAGAGKYDGEGGSVYGAGLDYRASDRWMIGGKLTSGEFGDTTTETAALRVSFSF